MDRLQSTAARQSARTKCDLRVLEYYCNTFCLIVKSTRRTTLSLLSRMALILGGAIVLSVAFLSFTQVLTRHSVVGTYIVVIILYSALPRQQPHSVSPQPLNDILKRIISIFNLGPVTTHSSFGVRR